MDLRILLFLLGVSVSINLALIITVGIIATRQARAGLPRMPEAKARCMVEPNTVLNPDLRGENPVKGIVEIEETSVGSLKVSVNLTGFKPSDSKKLHGFHVHALGDIVSQGCQSAGGHFNPEGKNHGDPKEAERHVGDWGNIVVDTDGTVQSEFTDDVATMSGFHGVLGRAIVVHAGEDDLGNGGDEGSRMTGNAGPRLACCVIVAV